MSYVKDEEAQSVSFDLWLQAFFYVIANKGDLADGQKGMHWQRNYRL